MPNFINKVRDQIALVQSNPVVLQGGMVRVDRKFHLGMLSFTGPLKAHCCALHPRLGAGHRIMDPIDIPVAELPYSVEAVDLDASGTLTTEGLATLRRVIGSSRLTYGAGMGSYGIARSLQRPYVSIQEYDLPTQLTVTVSQVAGVVRRTVRAVKCRWNFRRHILPEIDGSQAVHCNGFPIYDVARQRNPAAMLYLDSRMARAMVIAPEELEARLASLGGRRLRLLYSGRYETLKGAEDAVRVAVECLRSGLDVELHCYGQGDRRDSMQRIAGAAPVAGRIFIHDAIPYPELVQVARGFDLFVCCHIQNDPSCTYLESMGAGLPIVGYANRMWERLQETSRVGRCSAMGQPGLVAEDISRLAAQPLELAEQSRRAAAFAREHCFEQELQKRIDSINSLL